MSNDQVLLLIEGIGPSLGLLVAQAKDRLTLIAPFVKQAALARLLAGVAPSVTLTVFTRWRLNEIVSGASDLAVFDIVQARPRSRLLLHPRLHAKVILIDDAAVVLGSANITDAALAFGNEPNVEIMAELRPVPNRLYLFIRQLERTSVPATAKLRERLEEAARAAPPPTGYPPIEMPLTAPTEGTHSFPSFRSPDRLYAGYRSVLEIQDAEMRAVVLDDLLALSLPDGLDENRFKELVGQALLAKPDLIAFDTFVAQPRYFGEMAEWLSSRGILTDRDQSERKRYLQTLVRWLLYFLPDRYRLEEPNYSELFGRVEGWEAS